MNYHDAMCHIRWALGECADLYTAIDGDTTVYEQNQLALAALVKASQDGRDLIEKLERETASCHG